MNVKRGDLFEQLGTGSKKDKSGNRKMFQWQGEKRKPLEGEYYLSGAIVEAYKAFSDLSSEFLIAVPVMVQERIVRTVVSSKGDKMTNIERLTSFDVTEGANISRWRERHAAALAYPTKHEKAILGLLRGWLVYADEHKERFEGEIGEDYFLGPAWAVIGGNIRTLLNGETGRLDCGTLDGVLCDTLTNQNYSPEDF